MIPWNAKLSRVKRCFPSWLKIYYEAYIQQSLPILLIILGCYTVKTANDVAFNS